MRSATHTLSLVLACGFALPASAQLLERAGSPGDTRIARPEHPAQHTTPRGVGFAGEFVTMRDEFENYPVGGIGNQGEFAPPASFTGPGGFEWGLNQLRGQSAGAYVRVVDLAGSPVAGNGTRAVRITAASTVAPGGFYLGANTRAEHVLVADASSRATASLEYYATSILQSHTVEPADPLTGSVVSRLYWGGMNNDSTYEIPIGLVSTMHFLGECPTANCGFSITTAFYLARYCVGHNGVIDPGCTPPAGVLAGDPVLAPIGAWTRATLEITDDARFRWTLDLMNGEAPFLIGEEDIFAASRIGQIGSNTSFESLGATMYLDNAEISGVLADIPIPPPLECPYLDDLEWLEPGLAAQQSIRWSNTSPFPLTVVDDGPGGQALSHNDSSLDNRHLRDFTTVLPPRAATLADDLTVSFDVRTTGNAVHAFALFNNSGVVARVFWGNEDRSVPDAPVFTPSLFVQTDGAFNPIDSYFGSPDNNQPAIGVNVADTGFVIPNAQYATVSLRLSANGALRVEVDGQRVYSGPAAFRGGFVNLLAFESESNITAIEPTIRVDNIAMTCDAPSCATDFDFDDLTSFADLNAVLSNFGATGLTGFTPGDANADGVVNFTDLNAVLTAFGTSCQ